MLSPESRGAERVEGGHLGQHGKDCLHLPSSMAMGPRSARHLAVLIPPPTRKAVSPLVVSLLPERSPSRWLA